MLDIVQHLLIGHFSSDYVPPTKTAAKGKGKGKPKAKMESASEDDEVDE